MPIECGVPNGFEAVAKSTSIVKDRLLDEGAVIASHRFGATKSVSGAQSPDSARDPPGASGTQISEMGIIGS